MPRGEETQEPQEGRETPQEGQEANLEAERTQEVVEQPQTVVERERPVQESEQIEKEVVEAVEAVAKDGGPETEDREVQATATEQVSATPIPLPGQPDRPGNEISATPIPLPGQPDRPGNEISATPIPLPGQPDRPGDEISATPIPLPGQPDRPGDEISATPIPLPGQPDKPGDEISATPIPLSMEDGGPETEDGEAVLDEVSFKVETPLPDQEIRESGQTEAVAEERDEVILNEDSFKPVPAQEGTALSSDDVKLDESSLETGDREQTPTRPVMEKELPEGAQMEEGFDQHEDLQDLADGDFGSLMPEGKLTGPDGKESKDSKYGDDGSNLPGMDSGGEIDGSSEDPSGDQFPGKGMFKPGKGPGGGVDSVSGYSGPTPTTVDEAEVMEMLAGNPSEKDVANKEKQLQDKAMDAFELQQSIVTGKAPDPPKPKKSTEKSSPEGEEGGSDVHAVSQEEFDAVIDKVDGGQISNQDPDDQSGGVPDRLTPEGAKKVKDAKNNAVSSKHKQKKAGSEVITDPDQESPEGGEISKKENL